MTPKALRGMAANEVGRARISMMVRSLSSNSRPDTLMQDRKPQPHCFLLQRTAGPYIGVKHFQTIRRAVSMSLTGSCFSSESALGPFHHGIRGRSGAILGAALPSDERWSKRTCDLTSSIVPRGTSFHRSVELEFPPIAFDPARHSCHCGFPGPAELGAVNPDAVHDHGQPACQGHDRLFYPAAPGDLHRPGLEPRPFL